MDVFGESVAELVTWFQGMAPDLWRIAVREAAVRAQMETTAGIVLLIVGAACLVAIIAISARNDGSDDHVCAQLVLGFVMGIALLTGGMLLYSGIHIRLNPEYAAIKAMLNLIPQP